MINPDMIIAASLDLEPNRAAVCRDLHRAAARGIDHILVNENMVGLAMAEVQVAGLNLLVSGIVGYPIGQWIWAAKRVAVEELAAVQNGPTVVMHAVGPWLDETPGSREEWRGLSAISEETWVMTSLSAIPEDRHQTLADDIASCGARLLILSNGVKASGLPFPETDQCDSIARCAGNRFKIAVMVPLGTSDEQFDAWQKAGVTKFICADFWQRTATAPKEGRNTK